MLYEADDGDDESFEKRMGNDEDRVLRHRPVCRQWYAFLKRTVPTRWWTLDPFLSRPRHSLLFARPLPPEKSFPSRGAIRKALAPNHHAAYNDQCPRQIRPMGDFRSQLYIGYEALYPQKAIAVLIPLVNAAPLCFCNLSVASQSARKSRSIQYCFRPWAVVGRR